MVIIFYSFVLFKYFQCQYSEGWNNLKIDDGNDILFDIDKKNSVVKMAKADIGQLFVDGKEVNIASLLGTITLLQQEIASLKQLNQRVSELEMKKSTSSVRVVSNTVESTKPSVSCAANETIVNCQNAGTSFSYAGARVVDNKCECVGRYSFGTSPQYSVAAVCRLKLSYII